MSATPLLRSRNGMTVHLAGCSRAGRAVPWQWAADRSARDVWSDITGYDWLRPCAVCDPLAALVEEMNQP